MSFESPDNCEFSDLDPDDSANVAAELVAEIRRALKEVEPTAFLVQARVLRRVVKHEWDLPTMSVMVPHRKSRVVSRNLLLRHVDWDELGLEPHSELPEQAILLAQPDEKHLETMGLGQLKLMSWRLLYHSKIHLAYDELMAAGKIDAAGFRQRIDRLGQVEFDEIHSVLRREQFVHAASSLEDVFVEFACVYGELKYFAPHCLSSYFPSFKSFPAVDELIREDVDLEALVPATRLAGAPDPVPSSEIDETDVELEIVTGHFSPDEEASPTAVAPRVTSAEYPNLIDQVLPRIDSAKRSSLRTFGRLIRKADKEFTRGNAVGAALAQIQAARVATPELVREAVGGALTDVQRLASRLQAALEFDDVAAVSWYESLVGLLMNSGQGFWNPDKRLLYDLQKVCVDHEREIFTVDLVGFVTTFGKRPVRRALPNQREVLMSKHLNSATRRLVVSRLTGAERRRLSNLLHAAAASAEQQMRTRLRPLTEEALESVGLVPHDLPERIAFRKQVEELLDGVARRGFLTMGDLRDGLSRSNLKLNDLSGPVEFLFGDRLLKADRELSRVLDGVYQRSDFYLRWLQRLSAASFGTMIGRFATRYITIPYGIAYLSFEATGHIVEKLADETSTLLPLMHEQRLPVVAALGTLLLFIIHVAPFRRFLGRLMSRIWSGLRRLCYEWPVRFFRQPIVRRVLKSAPVALIRKFVFWPTFPTVLICGILPRINDAVPEQEPINWLVVLAAMSVILNSRVGRDVEELTAEWLHATWNRIRVHIFVALFDFIMDTFKRMLEWFERVLYAVDEWLRFKSGETTLSLSLKAVLGVFWAAFTFVARFCVNLLFEPQINPIKHFPVVTVSHKLILPLGLPGGLLSQWVLPLSGTAQMADTVAGTVVFLIPGIFGFMAWELKSNWQLYKANRNEALQPVLVGSHGETFIRLMKPGFHSGTLPKLFTKLRRVDRRRSGTEHSLARSRHLNRLHHVHIDVEHFVERELLQLLSESPQWPHDDVRVTRVRLASNNIRIEIGCASVSSEPLVLAFEEQSGWLVASASEIGWVADITEKDRRTLLNALIGFYRLAGVDLVREQIRATFGSRALPYDIAEEGLIVWPGGSYEEEAIYNLRHRSVIRPYPKAVARRFFLPAVPIEGLIFSESRLRWEIWGALWEDESVDSADSQPAAIPSEIGWNWNVEVPARKHVPVGDASDGDGDRDIDD